jgi:small GTP-binding protein
MAGNHSRVLDEQAERRLAEGRAILGDLREALAAVPATAEDASALASSVRQLDDFFLIVVVGEFNAGKSAFVNALLGTRILDEGVTPTTAQIHLVRYGDRASSETLASGVRLVTAPVDFLRDIHIVDTPGTNAIIREHEQLTTDFVPRSDFVLFVTSADRPFTETERTFIEAIREWGKKIVLVVNKVDIFTSAAELDQVLTFVRDGASRLLGFVPDVFPVSARLAWRAKNGEPGLWNDSRFEALERYIHETLDEGSRFRLKLANPLGVGDALARRYAELASGRLALLADDVATLDDVERQLRVYRDDLKRGFELRMTGVENVLLEMESRGHHYFEDTLRMGRVFDLLNRARVQKEFEDTVVADAPQQIERRVSEIIDWLVDQDFRQWQAVTLRLSARQREHGDRMLGSGDIGSFHEDRARLLDSVGREAQRVVDTYDRRREAQDIADGARNAVAATAAVGASALGLGAVVAIAASTAAADVTGILMAGVVAALGLLIIPAKRRRARAEIRDKIAGLRERLSTALRAEFDRAVERSNHRFADAMAPYSRFVRAEQTRWDGLRSTLAAFRARIGNLLKELAA